MGAAMIAVLLLCLAVDLAGAERVADSEVLEGVSLHGANPVEATTGSRDLPGASGTPLTLLVRGMSEQLKELGEGAHKSACDKTHAPDLDALLEKCGAHHNEERKQLMEQCMKRKQRTEGDCAYEAGAGLQSLVKQCKDLVEAIGRKQRNACTPYFSEKNAQGKKNMEAQKAKKEEDETHAEKEQADAEKEKEKAGKEEKKTAKKAQEKEEAETAETANKSEKKKKKKEAKDEKADKEKVAKITEKEQADAEKEKAETANKSEKKEKKKEAKDAKADKEKAAKITEKDRKIADEEKEKAETANKEKDRKIADAEKERPRQPTSRKRRRKRKRR